MLIITQGPTARTNSTPKMTNSPQMVIEALAVPSPAASQEDLAVTKPVMVFLARWGVPF